MKKIVCIFFILILLFQFPAYAEDTDSVYTASIDGVCSLYITPSIESYELMEIPACSKMELLDTDGIWNLVKYKNNVGWVNSCYIRSTYQEAVMATGFDEKKTIQVDTGKNEAKMYEEYPMSGEDKGILLPDGTIIEMIRKTSSGWGIIAVNDKYMWIDTSFTHTYNGEVDKKQYGPYSVYVFSENGKGVDVWESPDMKKSIAVIPECTQLLAREESDGFTHVSYKGMNGWVETSLTEESLFNAQMKSGQEVLEEAVVGSEIYGDEIELLSAPSYDDAVAATVLGTVEEGESVFVLRATSGAWQLAFANGVLGWLPPESTTKSSVSREKLDITIHNNPDKGFVSTSEGNGLILVSEPSDSVETGVIPETAAVEIIAEKNGYKYVRCDFGAGWIENAEITGSYEQSLTRYTTDTENPYITNSDTFLMSLPAEKGSYGSKGIIQIKKNKTVTPLRIVEISDKEWALVDIDGTLGWIDLEYLDSTEFPVAEAVCVTAIVFVLIVSLVLVKRKKSEKSAES